MDSTKKNIQALKIFRPGTKRYKIPYKAPESAKSQTKFTNVSKTLNWLRRSKMKLLVVMVSCDGNTTLSKKPLKKLQIICKWKKNFAHLAETLYTSFSRSPSKTRYERKINLAHFHAPLSVFSLLFWFLQMFDIET